MSNTTYLSEQEAANAAYEAGNEWVDSTRRHEKLDFLMETSTIEFKDQFLNEIVQWMGEEDFSEFFNHLRRNWDILTPPELDHRMNS